MTPKKLNVALLEEVKKHILSVPDSFRMETWAEPSADAPCGTVACIGGWAALIAHPTIRVIIRGEGWDEEYKYVFGNGRSVDIPLVGARALGFRDEFDAQTLFLESFWPAEIRRKWDKAWSNRERAKIAAERIDRYIAQYRNEHEGSVETAT